MSDEPEQQGDDDHGITSPPDPTHEATTPPGNPEVDEQALKEGEERLGQAGGGH